jgi:hypothetical protein
MSVRKRLLVALAIGLVIAAAFYLSMEFVRSY